MPLKYLIYGCLERYMNTTMSSRKTYDVMTMFYVISN